MGKLQRSVSIVGIGFTPLGKTASTPELKDLSERELLSWAAIEAYDDCGIRAKDIEAFYVGMSGPNYNSKMKSAGPHFTEWVGLRNRPGMFHDEACGSQAFGLNAAVGAVASGMYDAVLVGAVNINSTMPVKGGYPHHLRKKMSHDEMWDTIWTGYDSDHEKVFNPGALDAAAVAYCKEYGVTPEDLQEAYITYMIHEREQVLHNPKAIMQKETFAQEAKRFGFDDPREYLRDPRFNPPMGTVIRGRHLGLSGVDGASVAIVCATEKAWEYTDKPIEVAGISTCSAPQRSFTTYPYKFYTDMVNKAYDMAGITDPYNEIQLMQCMDAPPTNILWWAEGAGYIRPGETWKYMRDWKIGYDGEKPINTNGGLGQHGHCLSPSWMTQVAEVVHQMRGQAGDLQIPTPPKAAAVMGGGGGYNNGFAVFRAL